MPSKKKMNGFGNKIQHWEEDNNGNNPFQILQKMYNQVTIILTVDKYGDKSVTAQNSQNSSRWVWNFISNSKI